MPTPRRIPIGLRLAPRKDFSTYFRTTGSNTAEIAAEIAAGLSALNPAARRQ